MQPTPTPEELSTDGGERRQWSIKGMLVDASEIAAVCAKTARVNTADFVAAAIYFYARRPKQDGVTPIDSDIPRPSVSRLADRVGYRADERIGAVERLAAVVCQLKAAGIEPPKSSQDALARALRAELDRIAPTMAQVRRDAVLAAEGKPVPQITHENGADNG